MGGLTCVLTHRIRGRVKHRISDSEKPRTRPGDESQSGSNFRKSFLCENSMTEGYMKRIICSSLKASPYHFLKIPDKAPKQKTGRRGNQKSRRASGTPSCALSRAETYSAASFSFRSRALSSSSEFSWAFPNRVLLLSIRERKKKLQLFAFMARSLATLIQPRSQRLFPQPKRNGHHRSFQRGHTWFP